MTPPEQPNPTPPNLFDLLRQWLGTRWQSSIQRLASHAVLLSVALLAVWVARAGSQRMTDLTDSVAESLLPSTEAPAETDSETLTFSAGQVQSELAVASEAPELHRRADLNTDIPTRPRTEITEYEVQAGDTIFGIADKFGISAQTIMWGNKDVLNDDPHSLRPGQILRILPVNGVLRQVYEGDTIEKYAVWYNTTVDAILFWPGNKLDPDNPTLNIGDWIVVPGGSREFVQLVVPNPSVETIASSGIAGRTLWPPDAGPGACPGGYTGGAVGSGSFIWPTNLRTLSGTNYTSFHPAIDIAAGIGDPIYAADSGIVIFAGWSNWGYGNMVVISHRNGWQTLYAHLSGWNVSCGQSVFQGNLIGLGGSTGNSTGPHLHFEMNLNGARLNPWNFLP